MPHPLDMTQPRLVPRPLGWLPCAARAAMEAVGAMLLGSIGPMLYLLVGPRGPWR